MVQNEDISEVQKLMKEFDQACELLKKDYAAKVRIIISEAEKAKLEKLRKELVS